MTDIAAEIRRLGQSYQQPHNYGDGDLMFKAADEIERLRAALNEIANYYDDQPGEWMRGRAARALAYEQSAAGGKDA